jgi:hypothetical protein
VRTPWTAWAVAAVCAAASASPTRAGRAQSPDPAPPPAAPLPAVAPAAPSQAAADASAVPFWVANPSSVRREEILRVSLPFPRGAVAELSGVEVDGAAADAVPLVRWPDGSVAVAQAHVPVRLAPGQRRRLVATAASGAATPSGRADPARERWPLRDVPQSLRTEVEDPWGQVYVARLEPDPELCRESSPAIAVRRYRGVHRRGDAAFLGVVAYWTMFRGERRGELTLLLDNGASPHGRGPALGPVRLRRFSLAVADGAVRLLPRFRAENGLGGPRPQPDGGYAQDLLGPSDQLYLGDRTAKAFRLDVVLSPGHGGEPAPEAGERAAVDAARRAVEEPLCAWPDLDAVRRSRAFGAHGGPAPLGQDLAEPEQEWRRWRRGAVFGPFGSHGDPADAAAQGTPRNAASALHNVLRWQSAALLQAAETMVLQHALRPPPAAAPRLPAAMAPFRVGLSERALRRPHGFTALDYEHFSVDLLYDYYWLTGDPLARDELQRMGAGLADLLAGLPFSTCRGEGWCLQAAVLIARATGDRELLRALHRRCRDVVLPKVWAAPPHVALVQPGHPDAFGPDPFDAPWQMAALVHGLHALFAEVGDADLARAAVRVGQAMAVPGWVEGVGPKYLVNARDPSRYAMPIGFAPCAGTALLQTGAFALAAEMAEALAAGASEASRREPDGGGRGEAAGEQRGEVRGAAAREAADLLAQAALFRRRAREIVARIPPTEPAGAAHRWLQLYFDRVGAPR